jgi:dihydroxy-acid dehydratase
VTGKTLAENLASMNIMPVDGKIIRTLDNPLHTTAALPFCAEPWHQRVPW